MKKCKVCKIEKEPSDFNKNKGKRDGLNDNCRECSRLFSKKYYELNKEKHINNVSKRNKRIKDIQKEKIENIKKKNPCPICGESELCCLDFHHKFSEEKEYLISSMYVLSWNSIENELKKCIILCSNCHRKFHFKTLDFDISNIELIF